MGALMQQRVINERLYGLGEVKDFASGEELVKQEARRALILANAKKAGYLTQTPKRDPWHVGTEKRPSSTAVMGWLLNANKQTVRAWGWERRCRSTSRCSSTPHRWA